MGKQGWIKKRGGKDNKKWWKTRYAVLDEGNHQLCYYKTQNKKQPQGAIQIQDIKEVIPTADPKKKMPFCWSVIVEDRSFLISCSTDFERKGWIQAINGHIYQHFPENYKKPASKSGSGTNLRAGRRTSINMAGLSMADLAAAATPDDTAGGRARAASSAASNLNSDNPKKLRRTTSASSLGKMANPRALKRTLSTSNLGKTTENLKSRLGRSVSKNMTYLKNKESFGKLYLTSIEVVFEDNDAGYRPLLEAYFERQALDTKASHESVNPVWKEAISFTVSNLESRLKLTIYNGSKNDSISECKVPIKPLRDGKQRREWFDLKGKRAGRIQLTWRYEAEDEQSMIEHAQQDEAEGGANLGTLALRVECAHALQPRPGGGPRNAYVEISYGQQFFKSAPVDGLDPVWDHWSNLLVRNRRNACVIRVLDMDTVSRTHLGSLALTTTLFRQSAQGDVPLKRTIPLVGLDDPDQEFVGGELTVHVLYRDNPNCLEDDRLRQKRQTVSSYVDSAVAVSASQQAEIDAELTRRAPERWPRIPPAMAPKYEGNDKEGFKKYMKKKMLRDNWENSLELYHQKELEGDRIAMKAIVGRIQQEMQEAQDEAELPPSVPFPDEPPKVGEFSGEGALEYKVFMKMKMMREKWENGHLLFRMKEQKQDKASMAEIARRVWDELNEMQQELNGMQEEGGLGTDSVSFDPESAVLMSPRDGDRNSLVPLSQLQHEKEQEKKQRQQERARGARESGSSSEGGVGGGAGARTSAPNSPRGRRVSIGNARLSLQGNDTGEELTSPRVAIGGQHRSQSRGPRVSPSGGSDNPFDDADDSEPAPSRPQEPSGRRPTSPSPEDRQRRSIGERSGRSPDSPPTSSSPVSSAPARSGRRVSIGQSRVRSQDLSTIPVTSSVVDSAVGGTGVSEAHTLQGDFSLSTALPSHRNHDLMLKIIIIGDSNVGKTNLLGRWMDDKFGATSATINVEFATKTFQVDRQIVKIQLWDTAGQEQYRSITRSYYRHARGALVVYDITNRESFQKVSSWLLDVKEAPGNEFTQVLLIGNKNDLEEKREVETEEGLDFAKRQGLFFMETSAMSGSNVHRAFQILLQEIYKINHKFSQEGGEVPTKSSAPAGFGTGSRRTVVLNSENDTDDDCGC
eukprot:TRINITY_DN10730_c0_g1_i1.p1 TRINITY_DN10730_c0_g1~~TRINITY_DN10730_c0_g1_i1.p1  ORF type:complete len:1140 (-),score=217.46 TRINITY_DN10730_c0_g1_i1:96-3515(-)